MNHSELPVYRQETIRLVTACNLAPNLTEQRKAHQIELGWCHCPKCMTVRLRGARSVAERMKWRSTLALQQAYIQYIALSDSERYTQHGDMIAEKYVYAVKQERECWRAAQ